MEVLHSKDEVLRILGEPDRYSHFKELYKGSSNGWGITYTPVHIPNDVASELISDESLYPVYLNYNHSYWLGSKSIDIDYIVERRKKEKNFGLIYFDHKTRKYVMETDPQLEPMYPHSSFGRTLSGKVSNIVSKGRQAFELYQKLGRQCLVATEMGCSHQNVSRLIKEYKAEVGE